MTYNILDDSSFRPDLPFFGGERIIRENGKPGNANKAVIDKLVRWASCSPASASRSPTRIPGAPRRP
jgi:hypothetical protein